MTSISKILLAVTLLSITGCTQGKRAPQNNDISMVGSGNMVSQSRSLSGFDALEAGLSFDLSVRQGEAFSVVLIADDNLIDYLSAEKTGTTLRFDLISGYAYDIANVTMRAEVTMPELARLNLNGSSRATLKGFRSVESFEATLTGSSYLGGELVAENVSLDVDGSSTVQLFGSSENLRLEGCGSSMVDLKGFEVEMAHLSMACSSTAIIHVTGRLDGEAAQHSQVFYVDRPAMRGIIAHEFASVGPK